MKYLIDRLAEAKDLPDEDLLALITLDDPEAESYLAQKAVSTREKVYGRDVYIRGLIEFTNYCKNLITSATPSATPISARIPSPCAS